MRGPVWQAFVSSTLERSKKCPTGKDEKNLDASPITCSGDSGGPLTHTDDNGTTTLIGVVSGPGIRGSQYFCNGPTIYASVSDERVLKWIKETMSKYQ